MNEQAIKDRVEQLLELAHREPDGFEGKVSTANELLQGTLTIMRELYGPDSSQEAALESARTHSAGVRQAPGSQMDILRLALRGVLANLKAELDGGLVGSLRRQVTGDVLTDLVQLARGIVEDQGEAGKDVAGVLVAAAFEDTLRRLASSRASVSDGAKLADVHKALKDAGVLTGSEVGTAQAYLGFRNRALHAKWTEVDLATVKSVLSFVEVLLVKHFA